jgi:hypothetical protein
MYFFSFTVTIAEYVFTVNGGWINITNKGNNKITELRAILQRESQNS